MANAIAKAGASAPISAIAKRTFCFLHSPANIEIHSRVRGSRRNSRGSVATLRRQGFIRRRQHTGHGLNRSQDFLSVEMWMHRQRQSRIRQRLARREITGSIAEISQRRLEMQRGRVVGSAFNVGLEERG